MKSEPRTRRRANLVARHEAEHQRAGGEAVAVDDDTFTGGAHLREGAHVVADLSAAIFRDPHGRRRGGC